ncbi:MAG: aldo/keto reductase [Nitrospirales bacterium]|nr:aldo/keto reductase [Nitrospira sp.]MDR4502166.1 aldo/keto reductase [Nitrospirales bacterium]
MEYRPLGNTGLLTSVIGLGCSRLGTSVFEGQTTEGVKLLHDAFDQGINLFDTADSYGYGSSERILGKAFHGKRDRVIIASKGGFLPSSLARFGQYLLPFVGPFRSFLTKKKSTLKQLSHKRQNFKTTYLKHALEQSLRRLGSDYIDVYQLHSPPRAILERDEIYRFLEQARQEGKIRFFGISVNSIEDGLCCLKKPHLAALQVPVNILEQEATAELLPSAFPDVGILARVPLARGLLTDALRINTGYQAGQSSPASQHLQRLHALCEQEGRRISDVAIQFLLRSEAISSILVGTKSVEHLRRNILAAQQPALSRDLLSHIASLNSCSSSFSPHKLC